MAHDIPSAEPTSPALLHDKIKSGEFFRESMLEYHRNYHDIIAERYMYLGITALALLIFILSFVAINLFFPLSSQVPFVYSTNDIVNDYPVMKPIGKAGEDVNTSIQNHLLATYLDAREGYRVDKLDLSAAIVKAQSEPDVFAGFSELLDPRNPESPIVRFQRRATREIVVGSIAITRKGKEREAVINFEATVREGVSVRKELMSANIAFRFDEIEVDQTTGSASPLAFVVTGYQVKRRM